MAEVGRSDGPEPTAVGAAVGSRSFLERPRLLGTPPRINLSPSFPVERARIYGPVHTSTAVCHYRIRDVILDAATCQLLQGGRVIEDTRYFVPASEGRTPAVDIARLVTFDPNEDIILGYNNGHASYLHWFMQCLPAIDWSLRQPRNRKPRLLLPELTGWQEQTLRLLGYDGIPRLVPAKDDQYLIPHIEYTDHLWGKTSFSVCLSVLETALRLRAAVPARPAKVRVVYVHEPNPYYGKIENIDEVLEFVRRQGIHVFDRLETQNLDDTIALFQDAEVVIGPHGDGLANIVFSQPGTVLWEWMPQHFENAVYNRLAQTARVEYWGDLFSSTDGNGARRSWVVDLNTLAARMVELSRRGQSSFPADITAVNRMSSTETGAQSFLPLDELMLAFESLGDNCEFGLVQRHAGVEPLGLLRFASIYLPTEIRTEKVIEALRAGFEGIGGIETITVEAPTGREYMVHESVWNLRYHSGVDAADMPPQEAALREVRRLSFLRSKFLDDLRSGDKIFVWRCPSTQGLKQVEEMLGVLRGYGPNKLLWVVEQDPAHPAGTVEQLGPHLVRGFVQRFAPYNDATNIVLPPWFTVCQRAYDLFTADMERAGHNLNDLARSAAQRREDRTEIPVRSKSGPDLTSLNQTRANALDPVQRPYEIFSPGNAPRETATLERIGYFYDIGGLNNQKMSVVSLLAAGLATKRVVRLPYIHIKDQRTDIESLVAFDDVFDSVSLREWAKCNGLFLEAGPPVGDRGAWAYFSRFGELLGNDSNPTAVRCVLRVLEQIRPRIASRQFFKDFRTFMFASLGITTVVQLRIEADWRRHSANLRQRIAGDEDFDISFLEILSKVKATFPGLRIIYVTSDELSMPAAKEDLRSSVREELGISLVWKSDFFDIAKFNPLDLSLIDFEMARYAPVFVGNSLSSFANTVCLEKFARTKQQVRGHFIYNHPDQRVLERLDNGFAVSPFLTILESRFRDIWSDEPTSQSSMM